MGERPHTTVFNAEAHSETVKRMRERSERVHDTGQEIFEQTGRLDKMVDIFGVKRVSRNAFIKNPDGTYTLVNGIKSATELITDGTGSMGENVGKAFYAMGKYYGMMFSFSHRYQIDLSVAVVQDVDDKHPVFQMAEFESDNRAAEHIKKLVPDKEGGDAIEDYDLGLFYIDNYVEIDINRYGLKGYCFLVADQIGRGYVTSESVKKHLGHSIQKEKVMTKEICRSLLTKWHLFYIQVDGTNNITDWWEDKMGIGRVITIDDSDLLAEVQAGLVYVTETLEPSFDGFTEFLSGGNNGRISQEKAKKVWSWLQTARQFFGAQAKLPGYNDIPKPGDVFANLRDIWPIGHPRALENTNPGNSGGSGSMSNSDNNSEGMDWSKY